MGKLFVKTALLSLLALAVLLAAGLVLHFRQNARRVEETSAAAVTRLYAKNVVSFYETNNRFPNTTAELTDDIFGADSSNYTFIVVDENQKVFSITATTARNRTFKFQFQLSATGLIESEAKLR